MKTTTSVGALLLLLVIVTTTYALPGAEDPSKDAGWGNQPSGWSDDDDSGWGWTSDVTLCSQYTGLGGWRAGGGGGGGGGGSGSSSANEPCNGVCGAINTLFKNGCCFGGSQCYCCSATCDQVTDKTCQCSKISGAQQTTVGGSCGLKNNATTVAA